jgi:hypothetical protein
MEADSVTVPVYWSEMEATHIYNIFTMYAAAQLLINPDRDPDELLVEISGMVFGDEHKGQIFKVLSLIQDARSGDNWDTYMVGGERVDGNPNYILRTTNEAVVNWEKILPRAIEAETILQNLRGADFKPSIPLPRSPAVILEMILPNIMQIRQYAQFRVDLKTLNTMWQNKVSKEKLSACLNEIYSPIPDYDTWIGDFGQVEQRAQTLTLEDFCKKAGIKFPPTPSLDRENAHRILDRMIIRQKELKFQAVFSYETYWYYNMTERECQNAVENLLRDGIIERLEGNTFALVNWKHYSAK